MNTLINKPSNKLPSMGLLIKLLFPLAVWITLSGCSEKVSPEMKAEFEKAQRFYYLENYSQALAIIKPLAEKGYPQAQSLLGRMYLNGSGVPSNCSAAINILEPAAKRGDPVAQESMGDIYSEGFNIYDCSVKLSSEKSQKWHKLAFTQYQKAAEQGDIDAQYHLGICYAGGDGVITNSTEAFKLISKAAEQGHPVAQSYLSLAYQYSSMLGIKPNIAEAIKWQRKAAEQGRISAQNNLGESYYWGKGVSRNYNEAFKWYLKAAEQNNAGAQHTVGYLYSEGQGVGKNNTEAAKWYGKAAEQGISSAQNNLGVAYQTGEGVTKNYSEAVKFFRKAAEQDEIYAQVNLGTMLEEGKGAPKDYIEALKWYLIVAAKSGDEATTQKVDEARAKESIIESSMSKEQIAEAQKRAAEWKPNTNAKNLLPGEILETPPSPKEQNNRRWLGFAIATTAAFLLLAGGWYFIRLFLRRRSKTSTRNAAETVIPAAPAKIPGSQPIAEKYACVREIGRGGMAVVYEAVDTALQRKVALKKLRGEIKINPREHERFLKEARITAKLQHHNIVYILNIVEDSDIWLVLEFIEGDTLDKILDKHGKITVKKTIHIGTQILDALSYAHGEGILHRDLKPSNIMLNGKDEVKVMDFGIARMAKDTITRLTGLADTSGTAAYMAPEQHLGKADARADIFSFGAIMYELLAGAPPFPGPDFLAQKERRACEPLKIKVPETPDSLSEFIGKCLKPDPANRWQSAQDALTALKNI